MREFYSLYIGLDPGHGGQDIGMYNEKRKESEITLLFAKTLVSMCPEHKFFLTREDDSYIPLKDRVDLLLSQRTNFNLSIHLEYNNDVRFRYGLGIHYPKENRHMKNLARFFFENMIYDYKLHYIGFLPSNFFVVRRTNKTLLIRAPFLLTTDKLIYEIDVLCRCLKQVFNKIAFGESKYAWRY